MKLPITIIGRVFYNFEHIICNNLKLYLLRHEKSVEILFLFFYIIIQGFLLWITENKYIGLFILLFLFLISIEKSLMHLRFELVKNKINRKEEKTKSAFKTHRNISRYHITQLRKENKLLKNKLGKTSQKKRKST